MGIIIKRQFSIAFFCLCLVFFLIVRVGFISTVIEERNLPIEPDDSYGYILKAAQIDGCFLQQCRALESLRKQTTKPVADPTIADGRYREYHRTLFQYHPLHSFILYVLKGSGMSWEVAYNSVQVAGAVLIGISVGYFLLTVWGPGAAGITLAVLSITFFRGHGLHTIVPSNLTLAIAFSLWAAMLRGKNHPALVIGGIIAMLTMHPIGIIYCGVTLALYAIWLPRPWEGKSWKCLIAGGAILALWSTLGLFISYPALSIKPYPNWASDQSITVVLLENLKVAYELFQGLVNNFGGRFSFALVVVLGFLAIPKGRRFPIYTLTAVMAGMVYLGLLHNYQNYFGAAVMRLWIPLNLILVGAVGYVAWKLAELALTNLPKLHHLQIRDYFNNRHLVSMRGWVIAAMFAIGLLIAQSFVAMALNGVSFLVWYAPIIKRADNIYLDPEQPKTLLRSSESNHDVFYRDEVRLYYYLIYGALDRGAVYRRAVVGSELEKKLITGNPNLRFAVGANPTLYGYFDIGKKLSLEIRDSSEFNLRSLSFFIENKGKENYSLALKPFAEEADQWTGGWSITVPAGSRGWVAMDSPGNIPAKRIHISSDAPYNIIRVFGVKTNSEQKTYWPWDSGIEFRYFNRRKKNEEARNILFSTADMIPEIHKKAVVIADLGASTLIKIDPDRDASHDR